MKKIPLTKGQFAIVDDGDFESLSKLNWCALKSRWGFYAVRGVRVGGKCKFILMHRQLMKAPQGIQVDHINRIGIDNRRSNLRLANQGQNNANQGVCSPNNSGFKGVGWHKAARKWKAAISKNNRSIHLGVFETAQLAARAYDEAALKLNGEFARTNKMMGLLQ